MSYRGRPSKGCEPCRARKVKCDEGKPVCSRCKKAGHDCQYRDQADLLFRNQTASAAQRAEESWRKRSKSNQQSRDDSTSITTQSSDKPSSSSGGYPSHETRLGRPSPPREHRDYTIHTVFEGASPIPELGRMGITPEPNLDLRHLAFERLLYDFVSGDNPDRPTNGPSDALWSFLPILYKKAPEKSCLATIVDAVAYANFANRCHATQAESLAEEHMAKGIALLAHVVADKTLAASDEALCSVYMMGVFENLTTLQRKGTFLAHQSGATALMQLRSLQEYYSNDLSAKLYEVSYAQMLLGNIQAARKPPMPASTPVNIKEFSPRPNTEAHIYVVRLIWREAMVHARWHETKQSDTLPSGREALRELFQVALALNAEYQSWEDTKPPTWIYEKRPNTAENRKQYDLKWQNLVLDCRGAPRDLHTYPNLKRAWVWTFFRTARMFLLRDILEMINWMLRLSEFDSSVSQAKQPMNTSHNEGEGEVPVSLDDMALCVHRSVVTNQLVEIIETQTSAFIGCLTAYVPGKSPSDVVTMKGYLTVWSLSYMDAILHSGLIPDSRNSPPREYYEPVSPAGRSSEYMTPPRDMSDADDKLDSYATAPQFSELSKLSPKKDTEQPHDHAQPFPPPNLCTNAPPSHPPRPRKGHIFDSTPPCPFDEPVHALPYNASGIEPSRLDVAAKREWMNRMLYYVGKDLGIKKGLYVPVTEGYLSRVKPVVDSILGL